MDLRTIAERFAEGLVAVDDATTTVSQGRRRDALGNLPTYLPGIVSMTERDVEDQVHKWWVRHYPRDFQPPRAHQTEVPYPGIPRAKCDLVFSSNGGWPGLPEWAVEIKRLQFVGDNGKKNDHGVQKMLSPYHKDRSLIHDMRRMQKAPLARRHAVLGYQFRYDFASCDEALLRHPDEYERIKRLRGVCRENDKEIGLLDPLDLVRYADRIFSEENLVIDHVWVEFTEAWRHPCGGNGVIFAWEVNATLAPGLDGGPQHDVQGDLGI